MDAHFWSPVTPLPCVGTGVAYVLMAKNNGLKSQNFVAIGANGGKKRADMIHKIKWKKNIHRGKYPWRKNIPTETIILFCPVQRGGRQARVKNFELEIKILSRWRVVSLCLSKIGEFWDSEIGENVKNVGELEKSRKVVFLGRILKGV